MTRGPVCMLCWQLEGKGARSERSPMSWRLQVLSVRTDLRYWPLVVLQREPATGLWSRRVLSKL